MHRAGIVGKQQTAFPQFLDKLIKRSLADPIYAMIADCSRDLTAYRRVVLRSEQNPLCGCLFANLCGHLGEPFREPSFCRAILCARTKADFQRWIGVRTLDVGCWKFGV